MAQPATSKKPDPIDTPYLFRRGRQFHYRRRVPDWLQPIAQTATWWARLGGDEAQARREAAALSRRHDRLCTSAMQRLVQREGGADRVREHLDALTLAPLADPPSALLEGLHTASPDVMRMSFALHSALSAMVQSDKAERDRIAPRIAPLTSALVEPVETAPLTVSEAAREWLENTKPASARRYAMVLRRFREAIGDPAITSVTPQIAGQFRDVIKGMPALVGAPGKPGLPAAIRNASVLVQLAWRKDNPKHPTILPGAIENHLSAMRSLYSWCIKPDRGYVTANPFDGIDVPADPRGKDEHHHAALPYPEMPAFWVELAKHDRPAAKALRFVILTATRTMETMGATWSEIDFSKCLWTIPALRMKATKTHVVPLSGAAVDILKGLQTGAADDRVFPRMGDEALLDYLQRHMGRKGLTVHGFRSTFADWATEETQHDPNAIELALAHKIGSKVEAAYKRGNMFAKRRALMDDWAKWCGAA